MFEFQHYNQIHHKDGMIYVLIQEMYHLNMKKMLRKNILFEIFYELKAR
jgi:hypothetical protein